MLIKLLFNLIVTMTLISCSSNEEPSVQNNSDIKKAVSQFNDQDLNIIKKEYITKNQLIG